MRLIGKAQPLARAQQFAHKLNKLNIEHNIEPHSQKDGRWQVWIVDEEFMLRAQQEWTRFERETGHVDLSVGPSAGLLPEFPQNGDLEIPLHFEKTWLAGPRAQKKSPLTYLIALFSCLFWLANSFEMSSDLQHLLNQFSSKLTFVVTGKIEPLSQTIISKAPHIEQLISKTGWSLLLGSFVHKNAAELAFQLFWFVFFAAQIEQKVGTFPVGVLILFGATAGNGAQILISGPGATGLAGANCALFAFCYTRYKSHPWEGYRLPLWGVSYFALFLFVSISCSIVLWCVNTAIGHAPLASLGLHSTSYLSGLLVGRWLARVPFAQVKT